MTQQISSDTLNAPCPVQWTHFLAPIDTTFQRELNFFVPPKYP